MCKYNNTALFVGGCWVRLTGRYHQQPAADWIWLHDIEFFKWIDIDWSKVAVPWKYIPLYITFYNCCSAT